jgi:hypothetical protein
MKHVYTVTIVLILGAMVALDSAPARADVTIVSNQVTGFGARAIARPGLVLGDGVQRTTPFPPATIGDYDGEAQAVADFAGVHSVGNGRVQIALATSGDTLAISSSSLLAGTRTLTGGEQTDASSFAQADVTYTIHFKVSKPSTFRVTGSLVRDPSGTGGGNVFFPDRTARDFAEGSNQVSLDYSGTLSILNRDLTFSVVLAGGTGIGTSSPFHKNNYKN